MLKRVSGDYGGILSNYAEVEDPETEWSANFINRLTEDAAQVSQVIQKGFIQFQTSATNPVTILTSNLQWGNGISYFPAISRSSTGLYSVTFNASYTDSLGVSETIGLLGAFATVNCSEKVLAQVITPSANAFSVRLWDVVGGALTDCSGIGIVSVLVFG